MRPIAHQGAKIRLKDALQQQQKNTDYSIYY